MKFEKLSEQRIKITVSGEDLDLWGISASGLVQNTPEAQEVFWYIIRKAESETGFSPGEARLLVEAMPTKGEGIILFMTALFEEKEHKRVRVKLPKEERCVIYEFESFDDLCASLSCFFYHPSATLYEMNRKYYLSLLPSDAIHTLSEYGSKVKDGHRYLSYLKEHGNLILEKEAVARLKEYF